MNEKLSFACDYAKGAHPNIMKRLAETNMMKTAGYGLDEISESARNRIRKACRCEKAAVEFLVGGTQTNAVMTGALLAKGRLLGIQFDELFRDDLYMKIGEAAVMAADRIRKALRQKGYRLCFESPTNQIFCIVENEELKRLREKVDCEFWEKYDDGHTVIRFATDWGTTESETSALVDLL